MRPDALAELRAIMRGEAAPRRETAGTDGTPGTRGTPASRKCPSFQVFQVFQVEHDNAGDEHSGAGTSPGTSPADGAPEAERAAIVIELGGVPPAYAAAWAALQTHRQRGASEAGWWRAVDDAGRFLDEWGSFALGFGWRASDIFGTDGLAWFCAGERVRALGPGMAVTASGRIFTRRAPGSE